MYCIAPKMLSFAVSVASLCIGLSVALPITMPVGGNLMDLASKSLNASVGATYPSHALCVTYWTFGMDCIETSINLINQFHKWTGPDNCGKNHDENEKCMYHLVKGDEESIHGTHTTPDGQMVDLIAIFLFSKSYGCYAQSISYSMDEIEVMDNGRNYCNVLNLVQGCGLDTIPKYSRDSSNAQCTQFTTADCSTY